MMATMKTKKLKTSVGDDVEASEPLCTAQRTLNGAVCGKQQDMFLKKAKTEFPYDPAIPVLGTSPK